MATLCNLAGEIIETFRSDAEAVRFFLESGRRGDTIDSCRAVDVAEAIFPGHFKGYRSDGTVVATEPD